MEKPHDWTKVEDLQLAEVGTEPVENNEPRIKIPWDKIDEWIDSLSLDDGWKACRDKKIVLDSGDRRN